MVDQINDGLEVKGSEYQESELSSTESGSERDGYIPISRMNESNAITRKKSFEKGYQRGREEAASEFNRQYHQSSHSPAGFDPSQIEKMIEDKAQKILSANQAEAERQRLEEWGRSVEADFLLKSEKLKKENPDFDGKAIANTAAAVAPFAFAYSAGLDNSPEVWKHLTEENSVHLHALEQMVLSGNPIKQKAALDEIKKVSDRLKQNKAGRIAELAPPPIDRIGKATHGVGNGGEPDFDYFRNIHGVRRK